MLKRRIILGSSTFLDPQSSPLIPFIPTMGGRPKNFEDPMLRSRDIMKTKICLSILQHCFISYQPLPMISAHSCSPGLCIWCKILCLTRLLKITWWLQTTTKNIVFKDKIQIWKYLTYLEIMDWLLLTLISTRGGHNRTRLTNFVPAVPM